MLRKKCGCVSLDREAKDWSAYCENNRKWCWPFVWPTKWRESNSGHVNSDPVPDQYYNPVTATARGDESAITVIASSHPEYFFFILRRDVADPVAPVRLRTTDERDGETRCQRRKQEGWKGSPIRHRIKCRLRRSKRYSTRDRCGAINSRYIPAIVGAFLPPSLSRLLFLPGASGRRTLQSDAFNPRALFTRWRLSVTNWAVRFRHDATHGRVRSCLTAACRHSASRDGGRPNWCTRCNR